VEPITVHELEMGTLLVERRNPFQGAILRAWLDDHVLPTFAGRVLPIDTSSRGGARRSTAPTPGSECSDPGGPPPRRPLPQAERVLDTEAGALEDSDCQAPPDVASVGAVS
jgi:hypothetical protein